MAGNLKIEAMVAAWDAAMAVVDGGERETALKAALAELGLEGGVFSIGRARVEMIGLLEAKGLGNAFVNPGNSTKQPKAIKLLIETMMTAVMPVEGAEGELRPAAPVQVALAAAPAVVVGAAPVVVVVDPVVAAAVAPVAVAAPAPAAVAVAAPAAVAAAAPVAVAAAAAVAGPVAVPVAVAAAVAGQAAAAGPAAAVAEMLEVPVEQLIGLIATVIKQLPPQNTVPASAEKLVELPLTMVTTGLEGKINYGRKDLRVWEGKGNKMKGVKRSDHELESLAKLAAPVQVLCDIMGRAGQNEAERELVAKLVPSMTQLRDALTQRAQLVTVATITGKWEAAEEGEKSKAVEEERKLAYGAHYEKMAKFEKEASKARQMQAPVQQQQQVQAPRQYVNPAAAANWVQQPASVRMAPMQQQQQQVQVVQQQQRHFQPQQQSQPQQQQFRSQQQFQQQQPYGQPYRQQAFGQAYQPGRRPDFVAHNQCAGCGGFGHIRRFCPVNSANVICPCCGKSGHTEQFCWQRMGGRPSFQNGFMGNFNNGGNQFTGGNGGNANPNGGGAGAQPGAVAGPAQAGGGFGGPGYFGPLAQVDPGQKPQSN